MMAAMLFASVAMGLCINNLFDFEDNFQSQAIRSALTL